MERKERYLLIIAFVLLIIGGLANFRNMDIDWQAIGKRLNITLPNLTIPKSPVQSVNTGTIKVMQEESVITDTVDKVSPAVVTVSITQSRQIGSIFEIDPFNPYSPFQQRQNANQQPTEQDIGSGFIIKSDGYIVTNKHVVSDTQSKYKVITKDDKTYDVQKIYRDPSNDLAILKIDAGNLPTVELGDSSKLKVGQLAIAIGTALGEFRNTVTTGVISGIGRGITAGSPIEGSAERLDNVIQTDAAINPGNSGGPLLNSAGQVIGVNTAVSQEGQNIGFALPINVIKDALDNFNSTGQFNRPYLGVRYKVVTRDIALMNEVPEGAYLMEVIDGSPAAKAGLEAGDIITRIDETRLTGTNTDLAKFISKKKVGDTLSVAVWRDGKEETKTITLGNQGD